MRAIPPLLAAGSVLMALSCGSPERTVAIGLTTTPAQPLLDVIQRTIDSTHRAGWPRIELVQAATLRYAADRDAYVTRTVGSALDLAARADVVAAVGPDGSQDGILVGPVYRDAGIAFVLPTANTPQVTAAGAPAFRLAPSIDEEASLIAEFAALQVRARAVTVFFDPGPWGLALQAAVTTELWYRGIRVLAQQPVPHPEGCGRRNAVAAANVVEVALHGGRPDLVVLATHNSASACIARAVADRVPDVAFVAGDGTVLTPTFVEQLGTLREGFYAVAFWNPASAASDAAAFRQLFLATTGSTPNYHDAVVFDAAMILVQAIREGGPSRADVGRYLEELGRGRPAYRGVTGMIAFDGRRSGRAFVQAAADVELPAPGVGAR